MESNSIINEWEELVKSINEDLNKAKRDITKLVPVKKEVTRNGKTYMTTVYVSREEAKSGSSRSVKPGDVIRYKKDGKERQGKVTDVTKNGFVVRNGVYGSEIVRHDEVVVSSADKVSKEEKPKAKKTKAKKKTPEQHHKETKEAPKEKETKYKIELPKGKLKAIDVQKHLRPIRKTLGTEKYKEFLQAHGITWERNNNHSGADTMRASMAAKKWLEEGNEFDENILKKFLNEANGDDGKK